VVKSVSGGFHQGGFHQGDFQQGPFDSHHDHQRDGNTFEGEFERKDDDDRNKLN
jgi:UPF0716 protein FxsA